MIHYDTLFQNARDIITKCDISLLQSASGFFVAKCHSFIAECDSYYKMQLLYYKMRQLLQNATFITNCDSTYFDNFFTSFENLMLFVSLH